VNQNVEQPDSLMGDEPQINPIRVEMLSTEMPVHQLAKRGEEEIRVLRRDPRGGQVRLNWRVEPNLNVGRPGQLAYHLDTWVIKRRLDELPRPAPRLIRVGDLREIARELGHGGDTNAVKRAFEQNASAFIRAKLTYRTRDRRQETFEGYFNRYNVFFRGQSLPGGRSAETVYISLNDPYYGLINGSERRPLDFDYLRSLSPTAQRFYELLSPKMFAAIKNAYPSAWTRYSDFCQRAVQRRHETRRRMQIQMAAVHRPHLSSGYLAGVSYRTALSVDGAPDWTIHYMPGPRARAEFAAFNGGGQRIAARPAKAVPSGSRTVASAAPVANERKPALSETAPARSLTLRFTERRFGTKATLVTPTQLRRAQAILDAAGGDLDTAAAAVDLAAEESRKDPKGFPRHVGGVLEGGFVERTLATRDDQAQRDAASAERAIGEERRHRYEAWCGDRAKARIAELDPDGVRWLVDERLPRFVEEYRFLIRQRGWDAQRARAWAEPRILDNYGREGEPAFEEWCRRHDTEPTDASGPDEALQ
jgi:hypothetical protein